MAEARKVGDLTVNDGNGFMDNEGLIDSLIADLNNTIKNMASGQYIRVCHLVIEMVQKLQNLKNGVRADMDALRDQVEDLKRLNNELAEKAFGAPVIEETEENGNGTD